MSCLTNRLIFLSAVLILLNACQQPLRKVSFQGEAQGTYYAVTYYDTKGRDFRMQIDSLLKNFDQLMSLWVPESDISRINKGDSTVVIDSLFQRVFNKSQEISRLTGGAFDVTVGPLVKAWGFSFKGKIVLDSLKIDSLRRLIGYEGVRIENGKVIFADSRMQIDFNAIAQGYSVDLIGNFLYARGIENFLVDVGGEVLAKGMKPENTPWIVGIERPSDSANAEQREIETTLAVTDMAVATSGSYRKFYIRDGIRYSHAIDPSTGYPVKHNTLSVTVIAPDAMTADGMATAFLIMGSKKGLRFIKDHPGCDAWFIDASPDGSYIDSWSEGMEKYIRNSR